MQSTQDTPTVTLGPNAAGSPAIDGSMNLSAHTYILYRPPGKDVKWVPLCMWTWSCGGQATWDAQNAVWQLNNPSSQLTAPVDYPAHPVWTSVCHNSQ